MKKNLFFLAAATVALASCSNEEMIELNKGNAIDFRAAMGVATRGAETTTLNIDKFNVTAVYGSGVYFEDELFSKGAGSVFESDDTYYWPGTNETLDFYAYSNYSGTIKIDASEQTLTGFTPETNVADQIDFISAKALAQTKPASGSVQLDFKHNLVQAQVNAKTGSKVYTFKIQGVKFGNLTSKGDFDFGTEKWNFTDYTDTQNYEITYTDAVELNATAQDVSNTGAVGHMMVLPQENKKGATTKDDIKAKKGSYIAVLLQITTKAGARVYPYKNETAEYAWAYIPVDIEWTKGNRYVYTLDFSKGAGYDEEGDPILGDAITFTASVEDWNEETQADTNMKVPAID